MSIRNALAAAAVILILAAPAARAAVPSAGCGEPPPDEAPSTLTVGDEAREVIVAVPEDYDPAVPHRLILAFHGRTNPAEQVRGYYDLEDTARRPTLVAYPRAARQADGTFIWRLPEDLAMVDALVARLGQDYCLDRARVFAVGHSLGATFVNTLACARGDLLRGVASVAGGIMPAPCRGRTAALLVHNPEDRLVPVATGEAAREALRQAAGAPSQPAAVYTEPWDCRRYGPPRGVAPVAWCLHHQSHNRRGRYYPHLWPDGAEEAALAFFRAVEDLPEEPARP